MDLKTLFKEEKIEAKNIESSSFMTDHQKKRYFMLSQGLIGNIMVDAISWSSCVVCANFRSVLSVSVSHFDSFSVNLS